MLENVRDVILVERVPEICFALLSKLHSDAEASFKVCRLAGSGQPGRLSPNFAKR